MATTAMVFGAKVTDQLDPRLGCALRIAIASHGGLASG